MNDYFYKGKLRIISVTFFPERFILSMLSVIPNFDINLGSSYIKPLNPYVVDWPELFLRI